MFELCQDDDVLLMSEMTDPADVAVAEATVVDEVMGIADQRIGAWFQFSSALRPLSAHRSP